jgi:hypothetical protein
MLIHTGLPSVPLNGAESLKIYLPVSASYTSSIRFHSDLVPAGPREDVGTTGATTVVDLRAAFLVRTIPLYTRLRLWERSESLWMAATPRRGLSSASSSFPRSSKSLHSDALNPWSVTQIELIWWINSSDQSLFWPLSSEGTEVYVAIGGNEDTVCRL